MPCEGGQKIQHVLRLTNLSNTVWSSTGKAGTQYGIFLTYQVLTASGKKLIYDNPMFSISFVLIPGDSHYVAINVPIKAKKKGGAFVEVTMVQNGVPWPANPLRLPL